MNQLELKRALRGVPRCSDSQLKTFAAQCNRAVKNTKDPDVRSAMKTLHEAIKAEQTRRREPGKRCSAVEELFRF